MLNAAKDYHITYKGNEVQHLSECYKAWQCELTDKKKALQFVDWLYTFENTSKGKQAISNLIRDSMDECQIRYDDESQDLHKGFVKSLVSMKICDLRKKFQNNCGKHNVSITKTRIQAPKGGPRFGLHNLKFLSEHLEPAALEKYKKNMAKEQGTGKIAQAAGAKAPVSSPQTQQHPLPVPQSSRVQQQQQRAQDEGPSQLRGGGSIDEESDIEGFLEELDEVDATDPNLNGDPLRTMPVQSLLLPDGGPQPPHRYNNKNLFNPSPHHQENVQVMLFQEIVSSTPCAVRYCPLFVTCCQYVSFATHSTGILYHS